MFGKVLTVIALLFTDRTMFLYYVIIRMCNMAVPPGSESYS